MDIGFSILISEHIEASFVAYDDCRSFQIVCPNCREPVFKVVRGEDDATTHFLSHYAASDAYAPDCERRVGGMSRGDIARADSVSRGQNLELFLKVLRDAIVMSQYDDQNRAAAEGFAERFRVSKGLRAYRELMFEHAFASFKRLPLSEAEDLLQNYVDDFTSSGSEFPRTAYAIGVQKRIAWDVWQHVLTPTAQGNYFFLLSHAALHLLSRIELAAAERSLLRYEAAMGNALHELLPADKHEGMAILERLSEIYVGPPQAEEDSDALTKMSAEITHEAIGILLRLPYFDILKREQRKAAAAATR